MIRLSTIAAAFCLSSLSVFFSQPGYAQAKPGIERLYILNCGEGVAGDISRWSPGVNVGKSMDFVDNCYLIKHAQGWLLWDTGVTDAIAAMPEGQRPPIRARPIGSGRRRSSRQLDQLGVKPSDIKYVAVSHTHPDHIGNVDPVPAVDAAGAEGRIRVAVAARRRRFKPEQPVTKLEGDHDVFGDGSVMIISTPGHTPGHQIVLVKLPKTGAVLLSGDAVHFKDNWDNRRVPARISTRTRRAASMQRMADVMAKEKAQLWINHDKAQRDSLKMAPDFYD